jgi:hypothetical protein
VEDETRNELERRICNCNAALSTLTLADPRYDYEHHQSFSDEVESYREIISKNPKSANE